MNSVNYKTYIKSDAWKHKRAQAYSHYGMTCVLCGTENKLHVHHRSYKRLGNEAMSDLIILCSWCHKLYHVAKKSKTIPTPNKKRKKRRKRKKSSS